VPSQLGLLVALESLTLTGTNLSHTLPAALSTLSATLTVLDVSSNKLTGSIPTQIGTLTKLITLRLSVRRTFLLSSFVVFVSCVL
jgi:Leucine-rich repeat (LRR) protein